MTDEEKKEYEVLKSFLYTGTLSQYGKRKLIDIIEKQSKEIEELKEKNRLIKTYKGNLPNNVEFICLSKNDFERNIGEDYISKDKIKAKIEEVKDGTYDAKIVLQSLLEDEE